MTCHTECTDEKTLQRGQSSRVELIRWRPCPAAKSSGSMSTESGLLEDTAEHNTARWGQGSESGMVLIVVSTRHLSF